MFAFALVARVNFDGIPAFKSDDTLYDWDTVGHSVLSLFALSTNEGFMEIVFPTVRARSKSVGFFFIYQVCLSRLGRPASPSISLALALAPSYCT